MMRGQHEDQDFGAEVAAIMAVTRRWGAAERAVARGWYWDRSRDGQVHRRQVEPIQARADQLCAQLDLQLMRESRGAWCSVPGSGHHTPGEQETSGVWSVGPPMKRVRAQPAGAFELEPGHPAAVRVSKCRT